MGRLSEKTILRNCWVCDTANARSQIIAQDEHKSHKTLTALRTANTTTLPRPSPVAALVALACLLFVGKEESPTLDFFSLEKDFPMPGSF